MAEVVITPLLQLLFEKLASPILAELYPGPDHRQHLDRLTRILPVIQAVLEDAEQKQRMDKTVAAWLKELKHLAYDIDDLLDELTAERLQRKLKPNPKVHVPCLSLTLLSSNRYRFPRTMKSVVERLDDTVIKMSVFQFKATVVLDRSQTLERRQTGPYVDESEVVGRTRDVDALVELVLSSDNPVNLCAVVSVVGMGGIGKTTVAQLVYNDARVVRSFNLWIWISIGREFRVKKIMSDILDYAAGDKCTSSQQLGVLQTKLHESLHGRRYILVLDDVWSNDQDEWEKLWCSLRSGAPGSKIVVTTRSTRIATTLSGPIPPYMLTALSDDACLSLFMKRAFASNTEKDEHPELVEIGKGIVRKCRGVPLAARILGSSLRFRREQTAWSHVQSSELWDLDEGENRILSALKLSFDYFPSEMKRCFTYCAVFPKNFDTTREKLVQLWIAEGLIRNRAPSDTYALKKMEDTGHDYFNEFLSMSFFQIVDRGEENVKDHYTMHDLLHGISKQVAGNEFLAIGDHEVDNLSQVRYASVLCNYKASSSVPNALWAARRLRTLRLYSPGDSVNRTLKTVLRKFRVLRVLDLSDSGIKRLSKSIGRLIHLRYLNLARTFLETLPRAICRLCNLQTLNLTGCYSLKALPEGINRLTNLRHLIIEECSRLTRMPSSIRRLLSLQTLSFYIVGRSFDESLFQLMHLDLRGELKIRRLENANNVVPQLCFEQKQLHSLSLCWGEDDESKTSGCPVRPEDDNHGCDDEDLLNNLQPNACLKKLHIRGYLGINSPGWLNCMTTPNLRELVLNNCRHCEHLPPLGKLRFLEILYIQGLTALKIIGGEFYCEEHKGKKFFTLKQLTLKNLPSLEAWEVCESSPDDTFASLDRVKIVQCPNLQTMPRFPHVHRLELRNCNSRMARSAAEVTSLTALVIDDFPELQCLPAGLLQNNSNLETLTISSCPRFTSLPWDLTNLKSLKSLTIRWCEELSALPRAIRNLTALESLEITECPSLCSLPEEGIKGLHSLRSLSIENCCNLTSLPRNTMHLAALEHLTIMYCPSIIHLPDELQHLSSLHSLSINNCQELVRLPDSLRRVKHLEISSCPNVMELPTWIDQLISLKIYDCQGIKSLPRGVQCLNDLQHLSINKCPDLEEKCEKGKGQDWGKISHVPYTNIGSPS